MKVESRSCAHNLHGYVNPAYTLKQNDNNIGLDSKPEWDRCQSVMRAASMYYLTSKGFPKGELGSLWSLHLASAVSLF